MIGWRAFTAAALGATTVREFLGTRPAVTIGLPLRSQLWSFVELIAACNVGAVCVLDPEQNGRLIGMVTENNLNAALLRGCSFEASLENTNVMIPLRHMEVVAEDFPMNGAFNRLLDGWRYVAVVESNNAGELYARGVFGRRDALRFACNELWESGWMEEPLRGAITAESGRFLSFTENASVSTVMTAMLDRPEPIGGALVLQGERLLGIVSQRDIVTRVAYRRRELSIPIAEVMTESVRTIPWNASVRDAVELMNKHDLRHLPLVNSRGRVLSLVTIRALLKMLADHLPYDIHCVTPGLVWPKGADADEFE